MEKHKRRGDWVCFAVLEAAGTYLGSTERWGKGSSLQRASKSYSYKGRAFGEGRDEGLFTDEYKFFSKSRSDHQLPL